MDANSQADEPPQRSTGWFTNVLGVSMAAFTLIMPLSVTAYYSSLEFSLEGPTIQRVSRQP